jgi:transcriptional regulator with XRE-family HTH domain
MDFQELQKRLVAFLRAKVSNGELTERGMARITGVSQPHINNVLKGKRFLSREASDRILRSLHMDVLDLVRPEDILEWRIRR